eukprot:10317624-Alexandrium_andersonii.AAC.1
MDPARSTTTRSFPTARTTPTLPAGTRHLGPGATLEPTSRPRAHLDVRVRDDLAGGGKLHRGGQLHRGRTSRRL